MPPLPLTRDQRAMVMVAIDLLADKLGDVLARTMPTPTFELAGAQSYDETQPAPYQQLIGMANGTGTADSVYEVAGTLALWPLSLMCRLTTSGTVSDRSVAVEYRDGDGVRFLVAGSQAVVQASGTQAYAWHPQAGEVAWPIEDAALAPLPQQHLYPGMAVAVRVWNGQTGDVLDQVRLSARFDPMPSALDSGRE